MIVTKYNKCLHLILKSIIPRNLSENLSVVSLEKECIILNRYSHYNEYRIQVYISKRYPYSKYTIVKMGKFLKYVKNVIQNKI